MEDYTKIAILENEIEARLVESILTERNIPHLLRSYHDTAYNGLFQTQKGWGYVGAPESYQEEILEIISDLRKEANRTEASSLESLEENWFKKRDRKKVQALDILFYPSPIIIEPRTQFLRQTQDNLPTHPSYHTTEITFLMSCLRSSLN